MGFVTDLWLPIVLSAVFVFVVSSIIHMVLPIHKSDYKRIPEEEKVMDSLRGLTPGMYFFPFCTHQEMKSPEFVEKMKRGPVGLVTIRPTGPVVLPKFLGMWFVFCLIIGFFTAYVTWHTLPHGVHYLVVFRVAGTSAFMAYGLAHLSSGIWKGQPWGVTIQEVIDGLIYGLVTAGTFGWLWPR